MTPAAKKKVSTMRTLNLFVILCLVIAAATFGLAQDPAPREPMHLDCTSPTRPTLKMGLDLDGNPIEELRMLIANVTPPSTDVTPPVITDVLFSATTRIQADGYAIPANLTSSVKFSVTASDDIGVQRFTLWVDGVAVAWGDGGLKPLAVNGVPFGVWWGTSVIDPGMHDFKLDVKDAANNLATRTWRMKK